MVNIVVNYGELWLAMISYGLFRSSFQVDFLDTTNRLLRYRQEQF